MNLFLSEKVQRSVVNQRGTAGAGAVQQNIKSVQQPYTMSALLGQRGGNLGVQFSADHQKNNEAPFTKQFLQEIAV